MSSKQSLLHQRSLEDPESFWSEAGEAVHWFRKWDRVLDRDAEPLPRWYPGAELNTCYNALDVHVASGRGDQVALIYDSPITGRVEKISYRELLEQTSLFAGALLKQGIRKGDRVLIYMPMIPQTAVAMLACARIGAIHSVVFGGFGARELAVRIDDAKPKAILSASCGIEPGRIVAYKPLLDEAIELADSKPDRCVIYQRPESPCDLQEPRDIEWHEFVSDTEPADCVPVAATDPLYILYTSGTTGVPKGVVRDNGGHLVALRWSLKHVYGVEPGDVFWAASDVGWVVGHSYIVYGPLAHGCTTILYEGKPIGTPDAGAYWRVISEHSVKAMFTAPTAFRAIKREDPEGSLLKQYNLENFEALFLAGERCDPNTIQWARSQLQIPVIDHWWQTETGWPMGANCLGIEEPVIKEGSCGRTVPGYDVRVLDDRGDDVDTNKTGSVAVKLPLPPGCLTTLWNNDEGCRSSYLSAFPGFYSTADAGHFDDDHYLWIMSRTDDIINVAGHRLSTGGMEEVLSSHPDVAECAVIGVHCDIKGEVPVGLAVLNNGVVREEKTISRELIQLVRENIGPVASFKTAKIVDRLPKTRSGKILRRTMKRIADGLEYQVPATIEDPAVLQEIEDCFRRVT